jgi:DNA repair protein RAD50
MCSRTLEGSLSKGSKRVAVR